MKLNNIHKLTKNNEIRIFFIESLSITEVTKI